MESSISLDNLTKDEQECIWRVLQRDESLRKKQNFKVTQLKSEIHGLRMKGILRDGDDSSRLCVRCHCQLGIIFNKGEICPSCKFKICKTCRVALLTGGWTCIYCFKQMQVKWLSGEWIRPRVEAPNMNRRLSGSDIVRSAFSVSESSGNAGKAVTEEIRRAITNGSGPPSSEDFERTSSFESSSIGASTLHNAEVERVGFPSESDSFRLSHLIRSYTNKAPPEKKEHICIKRASSRPYRDSDSDSSSSTPTSPVLSAGRQSLARSTPSLNTAVTPEQGRKTDLQSASKSAENRKGHSSGSNFALGRQISNSSGKSLSPSEQSENNQGERRSSTRSGTLSNTNSKTRLLDLASHHLSSSKKNLSVSTDSGQAPLSLQADTGSELELYEQSQSSGSRTKPSSDTSDNEIPIDSYFVDHLSKEEETRQARLSEDVYYSGPIDLHSQTEDHTLKDYKSGEQLKNLKVEMQGTGAKHKVSNEDGMENEEFVYRLLFGSGKPDTLQTVSNRKMSNLEVVYMEAESCFLDVEQKMQQRNRSKSDPCVSWTQMQNITKFEPLNLLSNPELATVNSGQQKTITDHKTSSLETRFDPHNCEAKAQNKNEFENFNLVSKPDIINFEGQKIADSKTTAVDLGFDPGKLRDQTQSINEYKTPNFLTEPDIVDNEHKKTQRIQNLENICDPPMMNIQVKYRDQTQNIDKSENSNLKISPFDSQEIIEAGDLKNTAFEPRFKHDHQTQAIVEFEHSNSMLQLDGAEINSERHKTIMAQEFPVTVADRKNTTVEPGFVQEYASDQTQLETVQSEPKEISSDPIYTNKADSPKTEIELKVDQNYCKDQTQSESVQSEHQQTINIQDPSVIMDHNEIVGLFAIERKEYFLVSSRPSTKYKNCNNHSFELFAGSDQSHEEEESNNTDSLEMSGKTSARDTCDEESQLVGSPSCERIDPKSLSVFDSGKETSKDKEIVELVEQLKTSPLNSTQRNTNCLEQNMDIKNVDSGNNSEISDELFKADPSQDFSSETYHSKIQGTCESSSGVVVFSETKVDHEITAFDPEFEPNDCKDQTQFEQLTSELHKPTKIQEFSKSMADPKNNADMPRFDSSESKDDKKHIELENINFDPKPTMINLEHEKNTQTEEFFINMTDPWKTAVKLGSESNQCEHQIENVDKLENLNFLSQPDLVLSDNNKTIITQEISKTMFDLKKTEVEPRFDPDQCEHQMNQQLKSSSENNGKLSVENNNLISENSADYLNQQNSQNENWLQNENQKLSTVSDCVHDRFGVIDFCSNPNCDSCTFTLTGSADNQIGSCEIDRKECFYVSFKTSVKYKNCESEMSQKSSESEQVNSVKASTVDPVIDPGKNKQHLKHPKECVDQNIFEPTAQLYPESETNTNSFFGGETSSSDECLKKQEKSNHFPGLSKNSSDDQATHILSNLKTKKPENNETISDLDISNPPSEISGIDRGESVEMAETESIHSLTSQPLDVTCSEEESALDESSDSPTLIKSLHDTSFTEGEFENSEDFKSFMETTLSQNNDPILQNSLPVYRQKIPTADDCNIKISAEFCEKEHPGFHFTEFAAKDSEHMNLSKKEAFICNADLETRRENSATCSRNDYSVEDGTRPKLILQDKNEDKDETGSLNQFAKLDENSDDKRILEANSSKHQVLPLNRASVNTAKKPDQFNVIGFQPDLVTELVILPGSTEGGVPNDLISGASSVFRHNNGSVPEQQSENSNVNLGQNPDSFELQIQPRSKKMDVVLEDSVLESGLGDVELLKPDASFLPEDIQSNDVNNKINVERSTDSAVSSFPDKELGVTHQSQTPALISDRKCIDLHIIKLKGDNGEMLDDQATPEKSLEILADQETAKKSRGILINQAKSEKSLEILDNHATTEKSLEILSDQATPEKSLEILADQTTAKKIQGILINQAKSEKSLEILDNDAATEKNLEILSDQATTGKSLEILADQATTGNDMEILTDQETTGKKSYELEGCIYFEGGLEKLDYRQDRETINQVESDSITNDQIPIKKDWFCDEAESEIHLIDTYQTQMGSFLNLESKGDSPEQMLHNKPGSVGEQYVESSDLNFEDPYMPLFNEALDFKKVYLESKDLSRDSDKLDIQCEIFENPGGNTCGHQSSNEFDPNFEVDPTNELDLSNEFDPMDEDSDFADDSENSGTEDYRIIDPINDGYLPKSYFPEANPLDEICHSREEPGFRREFSSQVPNSSLFRHSRHFLEAIPEQVFEDSNEEEMEMVCLQEPIDTPVCTKPRADSLHPDNFKSQNNKTDDMYDVGFKRVTFTVIKDGDIDEEFGGENTFPVAPKPFPRSTNKSLPEINNRMYSGQCLETDIDSVLDLQPQNISRSCQLDIVESDDNLDLKEHPSDFKSPCESGSSEFSLLEYSPSSVPTVLSLDSDMSPISPVKDHMPFGSLHDMILNDERLAYERMMQSFQPKKKKTVPEPDRHQTCSESSASPYNSSDKEQTFQFEDDVINSEIETKSKSAEAMSTCLDLGNSISLDPSPVIQLPKTGLIISHKPKNCSQSFIITEKASLPDALPSLIQEKTDPHELSQQPSNDPGDSRKLVRQKNHEDALTDVNQSRTYSGGGGGGGGGGGPRDDNISDSSSLQTNPDHWLNGNRRKADLDASLPSITISEAEGSVSVRDESEEEESRDLLKGSPSFRSGQSTTSSIGLSSSMGSRDSLSSYYSNAGEVNYGKINVTGDIQFGLDYDYKTVCLEIRIKQCRDLAAADTKKNRSDPYVKSYLLPDKSKTGKRKTKVKKNSLNPVFDEILRYSIAKSELENRTLWLTVWHNDRFGRNDFLGEVTIPFDYYRFEGPTLKWYSLQQRQEVSPSSLAYKGELSISLKFITVDGVRTGSTTSLKHSRGGSRSPEAGTGGQLHVYIKDARNLTAVRSGGYSDPFCKGCLLPEKNRSSKQKTPVVKKNCNPVWNHLFIFEDVSAHELSDRCLELTLWDYDRLSSNDFLGGIRLNLGSGVCGRKYVDWMDASGAEVSLWQSMLSSPNNWVDGTLILRANMNNKK